MAFFAMCYGHVKKVCRSTENGTPGQNTVYHCLVCYGSQELIPIPIP